MKRPRRPLLTVARFVGIAALAIVVVLLWAWSILAIYYSNLPGETLRTIVAAAFGLGTVAAFVFLPRRGRTTLGFFGGFAIVLVWWLAIPPSHDRDWAVDVAVLPAATVEGNRVVVRNVRDFDYTSADEFTARYDERTYDLDRLEGVDLFMCYWDGNRSIAHTMLSFVFAGGSALTLSVETRKEKTETYSTIAGFFKQYELIYILADERDLIGLRTNHRGEDVYLYPMKFTPEQARRLLLSVIDEVNDIVARPKFYNALDHNCTTSLIAVASAVRDRPLIFDMRMLLNGYLDELAYERGRLVADASDGVPYPELRRQHRITEIAPDYEDDPQFSAKVRARLPRRTR